MSRGSTLQIHYKTVFPSIIFSRRALFHFEQNSQGETHSSGIPPGTTHLMSLSLPRRPAVSMISNRNPLFKWQRWRTLDLCDIESWSDGVHSFDDAGFGRNASIFHGETKVKVALYPPRQKANSYQWVVFALENRSPIGEVWVGHTPMWSNIELIFARELIPTGNWAKNLAQYGI